MSRSGPVRVGVNLLWLVPDDVGGTEEYAVRLLSGIADQAPAGLELTLFALPAFIRAHASLVARLRTITAPFSGTRRAARVLVENTWLASHARRLELDVLHHMGGTVPLRRGVPALVTIHDLQPILHPETFSGLKGTYLRVMLPWSVRAARHVIAVSRFTADGLVEHLGVPPGLVDVVPHGIDPCTVRPDDAAIAAARDRYGLRSRWFVFPSVTYPFKNHLMLVRAFGPLAAADPDVSLVLTGRADAAEPELLAAISDLGLADRVKRTGRIPRNDLDALIAGAAAVTVPSTFEGFGAPALEAMALATPVLAARAGSLPEVVGDAALLAEPDDVDAWTRAMTMLLDDQVERARLSAAGLQRAAGYGWDTAAVTQIALWRAATRGNP